MSQQQIMQQIFQKIAHYDKIVVTRHKRPDGDAIGSTKGLVGIIRCTWPNKDVRLLTEDSSNYLAFLGPDDAPADDDFYRDALAIVIDTGSADRISNSQLHLAKEVVKIDHHIDIKPYGDLCWVEDWRSSSCEMIAFFYQTFRDKLKIDLAAATCIFCGMVTDSGRFRYEATNGDTLRLAAMLLDMGIDTDTLYSHLYLQDFQFLKFQAYVFKKMQTTPNGLCYLFVDKKMQRKFRLTTEQACESVSFLKGIKGQIAQIAFIQMPDNTIRVRFRSRFMPINKLAEKYGGGGHEFTCGAIITDKKLVQQIVADGDKMVQTYKSQTTRWL